MQRAPEKVEAPPGLSVGQSLVVASLAGSANVVVTNPIWLAVTRMQTAVSNQGQTSFIQELRSLHREGGVGALWRVRSQCQVSDHVIEPPGKQATCVLPVKGLRIH
jgi:hypothetical protein